MHSPSQRDKRVSAARNCAYSRDRHSCACTNPLTREWEVDTGLWLTFHEEGCLALKPSEVVSGIARSSM